MNTKPFHNRYFSYLNAAVSIIQQYDGTLPLAAFLKQFFASNKKYGSKDRKQIAHLCYCYFRLGKFEGFKNIEQRILTALMIVNTSVDEAWKIVANEFQVNNIAVYKELVFPWHNELSASVKADVFSASHLIQPQLFLRIRPGFKEHVIKKLDSQSIQYEIVDDTIIIENNTKIDDVLILNKEVVVQDLSSQKMSEMLYLFKNKVNSKNKINLWDCCAASGGKSILAKDILDQVHITATDIRKSIIYNLEKRFAEAGINSYQAYMLNAATALPHQKFDIVMADVPCTGSGTWSRTPEALYFFETSKINEFVLLQKSILDNIVAAIKPAGFLMYSTCSVFKKENEDQVAYLIEKHGFELIQSNLMKGYTHQADTMFAALLQRKS